MQKEIQIFKREKLWLERRENKCQNVQPSNSKAFEVCKHANEKT
jgi:hypothetical protein